MSKPIHQILIRPILTEKSVELATAGDGVTKYTFIVAKTATKVEIAKAFETLYAKEKVKVASVNTMRVRGKQRRVSVKRGRRPSVGHTPDWKKAIVTLAADSPKVPMLEGV